MLGYKKITNFDKDRFSQSVSGKRGRVRTDLHMSDFMSENRSSWPEVIVSPKYNSVDLMAFLTERDFPHT